MADDKCQQHAQMPVKSLRLREAEVQPHGEELPENGHQIRDRGNPRHRIGETRLHGEEHREGVANATDLDTSRAERHERRREQVDGNAE